MKYTAVRSPRNTASRQNPLKVLALYEKNIAEDILNLSNCGLDDASALYFIQKAFASHVPFEINLYKNSLSQAGLVKLLPFLMKVQTVNLAGTGLGEGCLEVFSRLKGNHRL